MARKVIKKVECEVIEYTYDECKEGVYRITNTHPEDFPERMDESVIFTSPTVWETACSNCGHESKIGMPYPILKYRDQEFVLQKHSAGKIETIRRLFRKVLAGQKGMAQ